MPQPSSVNIITDNELEFDMMARSKYNQSHNPTPSGPKKSKLENNQNLKTENSVSKGKFQNF